MAQDMMPNLIAIGVSSLLSLITFLFTAWIKGQMKERILELELRLANDYVKNDSLDRSISELKGLIMSLQKQIGSLQRIIDRRFNHGDESDVE